MVKIRGFKWRDGTVVRPYTRRPPSTESAESRLRRYTRVEANGCWTCTLSPAARGYCMISDRQKRVYAHRLALEIAGRPIPKGYEVDHLCRNRRCVNPDHLEAVTQIENNRRSNSVSAIKGRMTYCKRGHQLTENPYRRGTRWCKPCHKIRQREVYMRKTHSGEFDAC